MSFPWKAKEHAEMIAKFRVYMFYGSNFVFNLFTKNINEFLNVPLSTVAKLVNLDNEGVVDRMMHLYLGHPITFKVNYPIFWIRNSLHLNPYH